MLSILMKMKSEVLCLIDGKEYRYDDGISAYNELKNKYTIISVEARENTIILELALLSDTSNWEVEHKEQFGKEVSYF